MSKKSENAIFAKEWQNSILGNLKWNRAIADSINNTKVTRNRILKRSLRENIKGFKGSDIKPNVSVIKCATYDALKNIWNDEGRIAALNFASYFNPGGGFEKGAIAQEESLCRVSGLYPILKSVDVYSKRREESNIPEEYKSELIYSERVPFTEIEGSDDTDIHYVDIISCAAPNCRRVPMSRDKEYITAVRERIEAIYTEPYTYGVNTLVLGAWGCGVFKNEPQLIANEFKRIIDMYRGLYSSIIFAVPNDKVYNIFSETLSWE